MSTIDIEKFNKIVDEIKEFRANHDKTSFSTTHTMTVNEFFEFGPKLRLVFGNFDVSFKRYCAEVTIPMKHSSNQQLFRILKMFKFTYQN